MIPQKLKEEKKLIKKHYIEYLANKKENFLPLFHNLFFTLKERGYDESS